MMISPSRRCKPDPVLSPTRKVVKLLRVHLSMMLLIGALDIRQPFHEEPGHAQMVLPHGKLERTDASGRPVVPQHFSKAEEVCDDSQVAISTRKVEWRAAGNPRPSLLLRPFPPLKKIRVQVAN
jgi:hypothetical protein